MTDKKAVILLIALVVVFLRFLFKDVIWHPNAYLFVTNFDGIKNYFTFIYYVLYDSGLQFTGMNYPFGEHIIYTDNQPLFSLPLNFINKHVLDISGVLIGIFNYIIISSLLFGTIVQYALLRKCLLPPWYSVITAFIITFFAQQNNMFSQYFGAYALSYTWVIPLFWLLIIKSFETKKIKWLIIYTVVNFLCGLIHPYYLLFGFLLLIFHFIIHILYHLKTFKRELTFVVLLAITAFLPLLAFKGFLFFTDPIMDRPETPEGITNRFRGNLASIVYPAETILANYWKALFQFKDSTNEGEGYIGVMGMLCALLTFVKGINYLVKKRFRLITKPVLPFPLPIALWSALAILLFAFGFPFRLRLEFLYDWFPALKQFRVLNRFLWVFYYVFSVYTAFYFYQLYLYLKYKQAGRFAKSFIVLVLVVCLLDTYVNSTIAVRDILSNKIAKNFTQGTDFSYKKILQSKGYKSADFQAILPFPYFTAGSEKITFQPVTAMPYAMAAAIQLHLPLINGMMSRTSLHQSLKSIQLMSNDLVEKELLTVLPSSKPLLLMVVKDSLKYYEKNLVSKAVVIYQNDSISLYKLPISAFYVNTKAAKLAWYEANKSKLFKNGSSFTTHNAKNIVQSTFKDQASHAGLFESGVLRSKKGPVSAFFNQIPFAKMPGQKYDVSIWVNLSTKNPPGTVVYQQLDENQNIIDSKTLNIANAVEIYKDWVQVKFDFVLVNPYNKIKVMLQGEDIMADNLLIKPVNVDIYSITDQKKITYNNYLLN